MAWALLAVAVALALGLPACDKGEPTESDAQAPVPRRPNVVVFVIDTCRADRCSVMGHTRRTTPHLAALAARGARFTKAWSPSSWTAPAHASLFTGLLPTSHGLMLGNRTYLPESVTTLAEQLRGAGYATGCFAENSFLSSAFGLTQGFEEVQALFLVPAVADQAERTRLRATEWALARHAEGRAFFAFVNVLEPHTPRRPLEPWRSEFLADATDDEFRFVEEFEVPRSLGWALGKLTVTPRQVDLIVRAYDAEVAAADAAVGAMIAELEAAGALDDTVFVVTSDHGENLGEHRLYDHVGSLHRTLLHVPLVIRAPGVFDDGREVESVVRLEDLFPTVLELCGLELPADLDAASLLRGLPGRTALAALGPPDEARRQCIEEFGELPVGVLDRQLRSVYDGRLHLIVDDLGRAELYDVVDDPLEEIDLADERVADRERLASRLLPFAPR